MFLLMPVKGGCVTRGISATWAVIKLVAEHDPHKSNSWSTSAGDYFPMEKWRTFSRQWWRHGVEYKHKRATWTGTGMLEILIFSSVLKQGTRTCLLVRLLSEQVNCASSPGVKTASFLRLFPDNHQYLPHYLLQRNHSFMYNLLHLIPKCA